MNITISPEDVSTLVSHGSVVAITGTADNGDRVTFGGETEQMEEIAAALVMDFEDSIEVEVAEHQVLSTVKFDPTRNPMAAAS